MQSLKPAPGNSLQGLQNSSCGPLGLTPQADLRDVRRQPPRSPGFGCQPADRRLGSGVSRGRGHERLWGRVWSRGKGLCGRKAQGDGSSGHRVILSHGSGGTRGPGPGVRSATVHGELPPSPSRRHQRLQARPARTSPGARGGSRGLGAVQGPLRRGLTHAVPHTDFKFPEDICGQTARGVTRSADPVGGHPQLPAPATLPVLEEPALGESRARNHRPSVSGSNGGRVYPPEERTSRRAGTGVLALTSGPTCVTCPRPFAWCSWWSGQPLGRDVHPRSTLESGAHGSALPVPPIPLASQAAGSRRPGECRTGLTSPFGFTPQPGARPSGPRTTADGDTVTLLWKGAVSARSPAGAFGPRRGAGPALGSGGCPYSSRSSCPRCGLRYLSCYEILMWPQGGAWCRRSHVSPAVNPVAARLCPRVQAWCGGQSFL